MNDGRSERRLREWFASAPTPTEPASLHEFLAAVPTAHPRPAGARMWSERPRVFFLAAAVAAVVGASVFAVVGSRLLETTPTPSVLASVVPASPSLSSSPSMIGLVTRIGEQAGKSASFAATTGGPLIVVPAFASGSAAGAPCPLSSIGSVGANSVDWSAAPGAILQLAGDPSAKGPIGLGVTPDCTGATIALPDGSGGFTIAPAPNPLSPDASFFARKPGDPSMVAAWVADPEKGGFISWSTDGGTSWQSLTAARPVGWDATGTFWTISADGGLFHSPGPGFSGTLTGVAFDIGTVGSLQAADIAAAAVYRNRILVAPRGGGLESVAADGLAPPQRSLELRVWDMSAGRLYVAVVGLDTATGKGSLAISADGAHFTSLPVPPEFQAGSGDSVRLLALDDRVLLADGGAGGVVGVWSVPVNGLPAAPPPPTTAPTPAVPSPPPAEKTSVWTPVKLPLPQRSGTVGGPGGGLSALPGGGFIDFVPTTAPDRSIVLTSTDGTTWAQTGEVTGSDALGITGPVGFDGQRYVALGEEGGGQFYGTQSNGAAWVSTDLRHWTKAPVQDAFGGAEFAGIAAGPDGFVAIGFDQGGQSVWTSPDGLHWTVVTDDRVLPKDSTGPSGILYTSHGYFMVGRIDQEAAAWTSVDGLHWTAHTSLAGGTGVVLEGIADGPAGFVSLGSGGPAVEVKPGDFREPVAPWISSDGVTWHPGPSSPALFGAYASIVGAPGGYVAAGTVGDDPDAHIWTSANGLDWVQVAGVDLPGVGSVQLVSDGRHILLSGNGDNGPVLLVSNGVGR